MTFADIAGLFVSSFGFGFIGGIALGRVLEVFRAMSR